MRIRGMAQVNEMVYGMEVSCEGVCLRSLIVRQQRTAQQRHAFIFLNKKVLEFSDAEITACVFDDPQIKNI